MRIQLTITLFKADTASYSYPEPSFGLAAREISRPDLLSILLPACFTELAATKRSDFGNPTMRTLN
jgi:hypothetical protein